MRLEQRLPFCLRLGDVLVQQHLISQEQLKQSLEQQSATGKKLGLKARARIVATAVSGADPTIMLTGPAPAARKALAKAGLTALSESLMIECAGTGVAVSESRALVKKAWAFAKFAYRCFQRFSFFIYIIYHKVS